MSYFGYAAQPSAYSLGGYGLSTLGGAYSGAYSVPTTASAGIYGAGYSGLGGVSYAVDPYFGASSVIPQSVIPQSVIPQTQFATAGSGFGFGFPQGQFSSGIRLTYFPLKGLAEATRLLLVEAGVPWEETAVESKEQWDALKPELLYGQVPMLEIDGKRLFQSQAINMYLARKFGFAGLNNDEQYSVEEILESIKDFNSGSPRTAIFKKEADAHEKVAKWRGEGFKKYATVWSKKLQSNVQGGGRHLVGGSLTVADIHLYVALKNWTIIDGLENILEEYPALAGFIAATENRPAIAAYQQSPRAYPWKTPEEVRNKIHSWF